MSTLLTTDDLRADALFRAGEPTTDTTGQFWAKSLEYLNRVQQQLLLGGSIAAGRDLATSAGIYAHLVDLPITDWWWARKRGVFNTAARIRSTTTQPLTQGVSGTISITPAIVGTDVTNWYVVPSTQPTVYRIVATQYPSTTVFGLDAPFADDTLATGTTVDFAQLDYALAPDFLRFASTPYIHSVFGASIDVASVEQRNSDWPLAIVRQGRPTRAFMIGPTTISVNGYDTRPYRFEYEYLALPPDMTAGQQPALPVHHRAVLSSGAAMLMLFDKGDSRAANLASEYRELVGRMVQEHRKAISGGSSTFGQFRVRRSGLPKRSPQQLGELYLL